jgi:hypothetical protein
MGQSIARLANRGLYAINSLLNHVFPKLGTGSSIFLRASSNFSMPFKRVTVHANMDGRSFIHYLQAKIKIFHENMRRYDYQEKHTTRQSRKRWPITHRDRVESAHADLHYFRFFLGPAALRSVAARSRLVTAT